MEKNELDPQGKRAFSAKSVRKAWKVFKVFLVLELLIGTGYFVFELSRELPAAMPLLKTLGSGQ